MMKHYAIYIIGIWSCLLAMLTGCDVHEWPEKAEEVAFNLELVFHTDMGEENWFYADGAVTALSDIREKSPVGAIELNLDEIADAPAIRFVWKNRQDDTVQAGTVAQYWQDVLPEVVRKQSEGLLTMDYAVAALVSAITLAREVRTLKEKLEKLEKEHGNNVKLK